MNKENIRKTIIEYGRIIIITVIVTMAFLYFVQISRVVGDSMEPNYHDGNIILVDKVLYKASKPSYNDVVVVDYNNGFEEEMIIKRIIALEGDTLTMKDNELYLNDVKLEEDYILEKMDNDDFSYTIPEGKIFVMGDNRNISLDSRLIGFIDFDDEVVGKVFFKLF